jgi:CheY-like chemotaxis protein
MSPCCGDGDAPPRSASGTLNKLPFLTPIVNLETPIKQTLALPNEAALPGNTLPLTDPQPQTPQAVHNRILIADDDAPVRGSLAAVLEVEGFEVDQAGDGVEAVLHAVQTPPNLILLDLNMPNMDGWTAFLHLDQVKPIVPVIVITARPYQYQEAVRLGVDAFMEKPLNIPVLLRAIKQLISESEGRHSRRIDDPAFVTRLLDNNND